ncbi:MAG: ATPase, partial [Steroidobacteraceae bacterium]
MPTSLKADASPQKDFLIHQLTLDITLRDCILDLVDNSVDGIQNYRARAHKPYRGSKPYAGYRADISFSDKTFRIV